YQYDSGGTPDGTSTGGAAYDGDGSGVVRLGGTRVYRSAHGAVGVLQNHGLVPPLVTPGFEGELEADWGRTYRIGDIRRDSYRAFLSDGATAVTGSTWAYTGDALAVELPPLPMTGTGNGPTVTERRFAH